MNTLSSPIVAIVQKVIASGPHGPFAVTSSKGIEGSITVSLNPPAWQEEKWPDGGTMVVLDDVYKKRAGWRANAGRFYRPTDESLTQEQGAKSNGEP